MIKAILVSSIGLNIGLLLGRLSGFAREAFVATSYGVTSEADVVVLMLTVPDLLVNILMGGAMGAMLVPAFTQHTRLARQMMYQAMVLFGLIFMGVTLLLIFQSHSLVGLLAPGFDESLRDLSAETLKSVLWLVPLTVLAGIVTAYLNASNKFFVASLGTLIINCSIIAGLLLTYYGYGTLSLVAVFVLLGGLLRLLSQLMLVPINWTPVSAIRPWLLSKDMLIRYGQAMFSGSLLLLFPVIVRALASFQGDGSVALLNYSIRLVEFPMVISVTFLSVVLFPRLAHSFTSDLTLHRQLVKFGVQVSLSISVIAAITLIFMSSSYAEFVYGHGSMRDSNLEAVSRLTSIGLISLPLQGFSTLLTAIFNSRLDTRTPLLLNTAGLLFLLAGSYFNLFGQNLEALMWLLVCSFGLICFLQLVFLKIEAFSWRQVLLDSRFLSGLAIAVIVVTTSCFWLANARLSAWVSLLLAGLLAILSLGIIAFSNQDLWKSLKS